MIATNYLPSSSMALGFPLDTLVLGMVVGVLLLVAYEAVILIAALLATRTQSNPARRAADATGTRPGRT